MKKLNKNHCHFILLFKLKCCRSWRFSFEIGAFNVIDNIFKGIYIMQEIGWVGGMAAGEKNEKRGREISPSAWEGMIEMHNLHHCIFGAMFSLNKQKIIYQKLRSPYAVWSRSQNFSGWGSATLPLAITMLFLLFVSHEWQVSLLVT